MQFDIITIFPNIFDSYFQTSILKRAQEKKLIKINIHDLRFWTKDKHKTVDDTPYGGGPGMILKIEPIYKALKFLNKKKSKKIKIILLTPQGQKFDQKMASKFSKLDKLIFICGRYEGIDARVEKFVDKKVSVGDYVLTGGELPAMIITDAVARLLPGVINKESLREESFNQSTINNPCLSGRQEQSTINFEYPQYTRPEVFTYKTKSAKLKKLKVPEVLLSGNHKEITEWKLRSL